MQSSNKQFRRDDGMAQLSQIVADLYKDVKLIKSAAALPGAEKYAAKHKGWTATAEDITGPNGIPDGIDEVLVRDKKGNIRLVNGFTTTNSKHALRQAYALDVPRKENGRPEMGLKAYNKYLTATGLMPDDDGNDTINYIHPNQQSGAGQYIQKKAPSPKKVYNEIIKQIWDENKDNLANFSPQEKLRIYQIWSNGTYKLFIVQELFRQAGIDWRSIPYKQDVRKITSQKNFKDAAYKILIRFARNEGDILNQVHEALSTVAEHLYNPEKLNEVFGEPKPDKPKGVQLTQFQFPKLP